MPKASLRDNLSAHRVESATSGGLTFINPNASLLRQVTQSVMAPRALNQSDDVIPERSYRESIFGFSLKTCGNDKFKVTSVHSLKRITQSPIEMRKSVTPDFSLGHNAQHTLGL